MPLWVWTFLDMFCFLSNNFVVSSTKWLRGNKSMHMLTCSSVQLVIYKFSFWFTFIPLFVLQVKQINKLQHHGYWKFIDNDLQQIIVYTIIGANKGTLIMYGSWFRNSTHSVSGSLVASNWKLVLFFLTTQIVYTWN